MGLVYRLPYGHERPGAWLVSYAQGGYTEALGGGAAYPFASSLLMNAAARAMESVVRMPSEVTHSC